MKNWKMELTASRTSLVEEKIHIDIFQVNAPNFSQSQKMIKHLTYIVDLKLFAKNEKELKT